MLVLNHSGLLVPAAKIDSTLGEIGKTFVAGLNSKRNDIFASYTKYNADLKNVCGVDSLKQWVDGSFVTRKSNPGDIDIVTFIDFDLIKKLGSKLNNFVCPMSESLYEGVDGYIIEVYPHGHPDSFRYSSDYGYWYDNFTKTRRIRGNRLSKGFLEIII